ncbi:integrator complex subunit 12-like isoform X2 [Schistocerca gregaria]|uniref:integrator complex subunit 12-like isoform X2 n=1 Tax=Schistocerca gregaria TaxID=7010 RepID=UPI00211F4231|nr:integrator complex subunit 12-like isoform X2 [Schistocerca gregaria]XP_049844753.1 integrator complex subunit 12-like isoform X2 [Schistocerca gregaria]
MTEREVDPTVSRAVRLMMSRTKESQEQLRMMLEDEIRKRTGKNMGHLLHPVDSVLDVADGNTRKKNLETRTVSLHIEEAPKDSHMNEEFDDEDNDSEINLEILEEDLTCIVCRGMDVAPRNRLIECTECHSLYHQECHQPPVGEADMEDPRSIWYCTDCLKTINRAPFQMPINQVNSKSGSQGVVGMAGLATSIQAAHHSSKQTYVGAGGKPSLVSSFPQGIKTFGGSPVSASACISKQMPAQSSSGTTSDSNINSITTMTSTPTAVHTTSVGGSGSGGGSTAAAATATTTTASATGSSSKSSVVPKINVISADKRLANMKKKAAKLQEKRKHSK